MRILLILIIFSSSSTLLLGQSPSTSKQDLICKKWRLFQLVSISDVSGISIDTATFPINAKADQTYLFNNDNTYYLYSRMNGIFSSDDAVNVEEGIWAFNMDSTRTGKKITKYNGQIVNSNMSYDLDISNLSISKLVFKHLHGNGYELFIPYK